jgi:hypothetical protein
MGVRRHPNRFMVHQTLFRRRNGTLSTPRLAIVLAALIAAVIYGLGRDIVSTKPAQPPTLLANSESLTKPEGRAQPLTPPALDVVQPAKPSPLPTDDSEQVPPRPTAQPLRPPKRRLKTEDTQIRFITVQTKTSPGWCRLLQSAALSGIEVHNIGWGQDYAHRKRPAWILDWIQREQSTRAGAAVNADGARGPAAGGGDGFDESPALAAQAVRSAKSQNRAEATRPLDDWDIIMFADGSDSAFTGVSPAEIASRFVGLTLSDIDTTLQDPSRVGGLEREKAQEDLQQRMGIERLRKRNAPVPLLFNAEANCYHQQLFDGVWAAKKSRCITAYKRYNPYVESKWRYLNAGGWIGYVWAVKRFFADAKAALDKNSGLWCDQSVIGGIFLSRKHETLVYLDYSNAFFLPTYHLRPDSDFCPADSVDIPGQSRGDSIAGRGLRLCHSSNTPSVLHFNGKSEGGKADALLLRSVWADRARTPKGRDGATRVLASASTVLDRGAKGGEERKLREICPAAAQLKW